MTARLDAVGVASAHRTVPLFGLAFERVTLSEAVEQISLAARARNKGLVVTPNVDQIVRFREDPEMHQVYRDAMHVYADGMPIVWLSRMLDGAGLPERVTGADLLPAICRAAAARDYSVYFLGGDSGVAETAARRLCEANPTLRIAGTDCPPWGFERDEAMSRRLIDRINESGADLLFLGVGAPKQEKWGHRYQPMLEVGPIVCVGAAFAFAAGVARRAPRILQQSGFEWCWRLAREPRRLWRRYLLDDTRFVVDAVREFRLFRQRRVEASSREDQS